MNADGEVSLRTPQNLDLRVERPHMPGSGPTVCLASRFLVTMPYLVSTLVAALVSYALIVVVTRLSSRGQPTKHSPGPSPLPLIGNVHQLPAEYIEQRFAQWARRYGAHVQALRPGKQRH